VGAGKSRWVRADKGAGGYANPRRKGKDGKKGGEEFEPPSREKKRGREKKKTFLAQNTKTQQPIDFPHKIHTERRGIKKKKAIPDCRRAGRKKKKGGRSCHHEEVGDEKDSRNSSKEKKKAERSCLCLGSGEGREEKEKPIFGRGGLRRTPRGSDANTGGGERGGGEFPKAEGGRKMLEFQLQIIKDGKPDVKDMDGRQFQGERGSS